jgi:DNA (cytosine-5)-methyltransferase 1
LDIPIPIIDIFAGPGGLGEGFSAFRSDLGESIFKLKLSIEKDVFARRTLLLRAFFRQFDKSSVPSSYYEYLKGNINREELFRRYPTEASNAKKEAWQIELKKANREKVKSRINNALSGAVNWVLIGGPPCQAYSLIGRSRMRSKNGKKYLRDRRHFLYKEYLQILADHQPPVFIMENVKGLLSSEIKKKNTFELIISDLKNPLEVTRFNTSEPLTYLLFSFSKRRPTNDELEPEDFIVRSENYGIPQARHRIFIFGVRSDIYKSEFTLMEKTKQVSIDDVIDDLPKLRSGLSKGEDSSKKWHDEIRSISNEKWLGAISLDLQEEIKKAIKRVGKNLMRDSTTLVSPSVPKKYADWYMDKALTGIYNHETRAHIKEDLHRYFFASVFARLHRRSPTLSDFPKELLPNHKNVQKAVDGLMFNDRFRVQVRGKPSTTVVSHISKDGHYYIHYDPAQCRSLTVREAARLQTFPDNYFFEGNRTQQYHQVGNAVPPLLAKKIASIVFEVLENSAESKFRDIYINENRYESIPHKQAKGMENEVKTGG